MKYPILLVHGMGFRDNDRIGYWGRIPNALKEAGCDVYFGYQDSNADIETNAECLARRIDQIIGQTGAEKINIIAHSKGGLDCRYALSILGAGNKVASLTTISTPHHGSKTMDLLMRFPDPLIRFAGLCADCWFRLLGDKNPNSYKVFRALTTEAAEKFNASTPDCDGVMYQSYAFVMKSPFSDIFMLFPNLVIGMLEGENDGLLTPQAVQWSEFRGVYRGAGRRGISHCDEVDMRRRPLSKASGNGISDIVDFYFEVIAALAERGF
ncbi:MAG: alpha/beta fold hydrolase [Oscillospiraceae bacterium]|nr:alpha/beta fold hydrolase [Oscillospiraceae bacterium]